MKLQIQLELFHFDQKKRLTPLPLKGDGKPATNNKLIYWQEVVQLILSVAQEKFSNTLVLPGSGAPNASSLKIIILLLRNENLCDHECYRNFIHSSLRAISPDPKEQGPDTQFQSKSFYPVITIGLEDIMNLYAEESIQDQNRNRFLYKHRYDPRAKFFDSSIWHRYVPILSGSGHFPARLEAVIRDMIRWHAQGLFQTNAALATLEFDLRKLQNSYIAKVGNRGHNELVTPFKFHSETAFADKARRIHAFLSQVLQKTSLSKELRWEILLVDDQANTPISSKEGRCLLSKTQLIQGLLKDWIQFQISSSANNYEVAGQCAEALTKKAYDIILVDYLLGDNQQLDRREYGYDFLRILEKDRAPSGSLLKRGPLGKFWLFPTSSFPHALTDKLRELGINNLNSHWHMSNGGDPLCTPELFRYNLLEFANQQISACFLNRQSLRGFLSNFSGIQDTKLWAEAVLNGLKYLEAQEKVLKSDQQNHSEFADSMLAFLDKQKKNKTLRKELKGFLRAVKDNSRRDNVEQKWKDLLQLNRTYEELLQDIRKYIKGLRETIFISCAPEDRHYLENLKKHLRPSMRRITVSIWDRTQLVGGEEVEKVVRSHIREANTFLCLLSPDYLDNNHCDWELSIALECRDSFNTRIVPILIRHCNLDSGTLLHSFQALPKNEKPISIWIDEDEAWTEVCRELMRLV